MPPRHAPPMPTPLEVELQQHIAALRRIARGLVGAESAEDLVQDTVVQALQSTAPPPRSWGAWLGTVLRFLANKHRRNERRRARHELAAIGIDTAPPADRALEHEETLRSLTDAVLSLPQPYRRVVLQRYLHECAPAEIAAQTGVPLATVKSQLQRGLAMLRDAMAARSPRRDWRAALTSTFALPRTTAAPFVATGVFMTIGTKWLLGIAALVVAGVVIEWARETTANATAPATAAAGRTVNAALAGGPNTSPGANERSAASAAVHDDTLEVRGRCVDPRGEPLVGITATLHAEGPPRDPGATVATDASGRFVLRRRPPCTLRLEAPACCTLVRENLRGRNSGALDLGDLSLLPAIRVQGILRARSGEPIADAELFVRHTTIDSSQDLRTAASLHTGPDGRFGPSIGLPPGRGRISGESCHLVGTRVEFALDPAQPVVELELVEADRSALPAVAGTVVDEAGAPIAGASVNLLGDTVQSAADGTFRVVCGDPEFGPGPFHLQVWVGRDDANYEQAWLGPFALGCTDARLVLHRVPALTLRVRRASDQRPVEDYGTFLWRQRQNTPPSRSEITTWPQGISVHALPRGEYVATIVPDDQQLATVTSKPFLVDRDATIDFELPANGSRVLALSDTEGRPLEGVGVELLQENGTPITADANAADLGDMPYIEPTSPLRLLRGSTDARGELQLRGPTGRPLALRLSGPGPVQSILQPIFLDPTTRLEHRLPTPGSFRGRLVPQDVVDELLRGDGARRNDLALVVHLGPVPRYALTGARIAVAADGTFTGELPSGRWNVTLLCGTATLPIGAVDIAPVVGSQVDLSIAALRRSEVELRLMVDGEPLAYGTVDCIVRHGGTDLAGMHWMETQRADQQGRVRLRMFPGTLTAAVRLPPVGGFGNLIVYPAEGLVVPSGTSLVLTVDVHPTPIEVAVRTADGRPAVDVPLRLVGTGARGPNLKETDGAGIARGNRIDTGHYTVWTAPRSYGSDLTVIPRDAWFAVGTIDVRRSGDGARFELTLPRHWDR